jgi:hypothetical protein
MTDKRFADIRAEYEETGCIQGSEVLALLDEVERLRQEAVKRERAYIEAALLAPKEEQRDKWEICGSTWTAYAEAIVKSQAREIKALRAGIQRLIDELSPHAPGGIANVDEWSGIGMADIAGLRRTLVALLGGTAEAAKG